MLYPVRNLWAKGVVSTYDFPSHDLPPSGVTRASNVLFRDGKIQKAAGWSTELDAADQVDTDFELYWFDSWSDSNGIFTAFGASDGTSSKIYTTDDGDTLVEAVTKDKTGAVIVLSPSTTWQMELFGRFLIVNNGVDPPMYSESFAVGVWTFKELPGWGDAGSPGGAVRAIRSYKNYLIAIGVADTPYTIYWSDLGSVEEVPTSWDYADPATQAGRNPLEAHDGLLVDGEHLNDRLVVFQDEACTSMEYAQGGGVFSFRRLFNHGLSAVNAVATMEGTQLFVDADAIHIHDGSRIESPADSRVQTQFSAEVTDYSRVFVTKDEARREALILYPTDGSDFPNKVLIYGWQDNSWSFEDLGTEVRCLQESSVPSSSFAWEDLVGSWGSLGGTWFSLGLVSRTDALYQLEALLWSRRGATYTRPGEDIRRLSESFYERRRTSDGSERRVSGTAETDYYAYVERTYMDLDELTQQSATVKHVRALYPQITGSGQVSFQFGVSATPFDPVSWKTTKTLDLDTENTRKKIDTRLTGRYLHWRVGSWEGVPKNGNWQFSGMDLDIQLQGVR